MSETLHNHVSETAAADEAARQYAEQKRQALADMFADVAPGIMRARKAFMRDLPELLNNRKCHGWCVAYYQEERIALFPERQDVIREILKRELKDDEYFIGAVVPYDDEEWEIDQSLYEFDEIE
jgi:hypothetical protein